MGIATSANIGFATKCWENDWRILLQRGRLAAMIARCAYPFAYRLLAINNVRDHAVVQAAAEKAVRDGVIDHYIFVADHAEKTLRHFQIDPASFGRGYYYSIAELSEIHQAPTDFLVHFSSDSILATTTDWITPALRIFAERQDIAVANPVWNGRYQEAAAEAEETTADYFVSYGFSDQCYMVRRAEFDQPIYNETHPAAARYPKYADELFEKRVDAYLRNHQRKRATLRCANYRHRNWSFYRKLTYRITHISQ